MSYRESDGTPPDEQACLDCKKDIHRTDEGGGASRCDECKQWLCGFCTIAAWDGEEKVNCKDCNRKARGLFTMAELEEQGQQRLIP